MPNSKVFSLNYTAADIPIFNQFIDKGSVSDMPALAIILLIIATILIIICIVVYSYCKIAKKVGLCKDCWEK